MGTYTASIIMTCFSMLVLIFLAKGGTTLTKTAKRGTIISAALIMLCSASECIGVMLDGADPSFRILHIIAKIIELSVTPVIPAVFANAFFPIKAKKAAVVFFAVHGAVEVLSAFLGITFYVDEQNVYHHCTFYAAYYAAIAVGVIFLAVSVVMFNLSYQGRHKAPLYLLVAFVLTGVSVQAVNESIRVVWLTVAFGIILFYIYYCSTILHVDGLTGLMNRRSYDNRIQNEHNRVGILFFDVNNFKGINDQYGHQFGDKCLISVSKAIRTAYGKDGLCYRIGGDEFCVILDKRIQRVDELNAAFDNAMAKRRAKESRLPTVSVGYSVFEPESMTFKDAISAADMNMYQVKNKAKAEQK